MLVNLPSFNILAIDPGSNLGVTVACIDIPQKQMNVLECNTHKQDDLYKTFSDEEKLFFDKKQLVYDYSKNLLCEYMRQYQVEHVIYEAAYSSISVIAYESLLRCGKMIVDATFDYDADLVTESVAPSAVKKVMGVKGGSGDKQLISQAILANPYITFNCDTANLTEHAWDSVAIAYYAFQSLRLRL